MTYVDLEAFIELLFTESLFFQHEMLNILLIRCRNLFKNNEISFSRFYKFLECKYPSIRQIILNKAKMIASKNKCSSVLPRTFPPVKPVIHVSINAIKENTENTLPSLMKRIPFFIIYFLNERKKSQYLHCRIIIGPVLMQSCRRRLIIAFNKIQPSNCNLNTPGESN